MEEKFKATLELAEELGSWAAFAAYMLGVTDTGDEDFNNLLADLYSINEKVHLRANQLSLKYELPFFSGIRDG